jgi:hypothetical protein
MKHARQVPCRVTLAVVSLIIFFTLFPPPYISCMNITSSSSLMYIYVLSLGTPCERINCLNGGYCIQPASQTTLAYCHCPSKYAGYRCEQPGKQLSLFLLLYMLSVCHLPSTG